MKAIIIVLALTAATLAADYDPMTINIGQTYAPNGHDAYSLECTGAVGRVTYQVQGLPTGAQFNNNVITLTAATPAGDYVLRIRATDQAGNYAERIVNLSVIDQNVSSSSSSSSSGSTSTNSASGSSSAAINNARLNALITQHSSFITDVTTTNFNYEGNRYPEPSLPTGGDSTAVNVQINQINSQQATPTTSNRNQITADDVSLKAASERHQNAVKAITNLLTIIDQARANRNQALSSIDRYNLELKNAKGTQRQTQETIISIQTKIQQISSAINGISSGNDNLQTRIDSLITERQTLINRNQELKQLIQGQTSKRNSIQAQLDQVNRDINAQKSALAQKETQCDNLRAEIQRVQTELSNLKAQASRLEVQINAAQKDLENKQKVVDDLERRLADAKIARDSARDSLNALVRDRNSILPRIDALNAQLAELRSKLQACNAAAAQIRARIGELEQSAANLQKSIDEINAVINGYQREITNNEGRIGEIDGVLPTLQNNQSSSLDDLSYLQDQLVKAQADLRNAHRAGNDANTAVLFAQQNLDAATQRYNKENENVSTATLNLEKARAQEALARLALEETIAHYTDALPYSIVPNGNGMTPAGTPYGNNPSGSPLGPVNTNTDGAPGSFVVSNWTHYLSQAFGAGVNPAYQGSVNRIYPFNFFSNVNGNTVSNNYNGLRAASSTTSNICSGNGAVRSTTGQIIGVNENSFDLQLDDGSVMHINIAPCTQMNANQPNYTMSSGNVAIVKGIQNSSNSMNGQSVMCLA